MTAHGAAEHREDEGFDHSRNPVLNWGWPLLLLALLAYALAAGG